MKIARLLVAALVSTGLLSAQDPLSRIKKLQDEGIGTTPLAAINACQPLAPSPLGAWVPPNLTLNVTPQTTSTPPLSFGSFPVNIPPLTLAISPATVTVPGTAFLPPAPRLCPASSTGDVGGAPPQPPGKSRYDLQLSIDFSTTRSNGSGGGCSLASGRLTLVKADQGNAQDVLMMNHAGLLCDTAGIFSAKTYTATYHITGGTRKYAGASGTGSFTASMDAVRTLLHLEGNVLIP